VAYPDTLIRIRVPEAILDPSLLALIWNSAVVREQLEPQARTTAGIYKVNQSMLSEVRLPVPPRDEQTRIVAEVERQMSFLDACERSVDAGLEVSAGLRRSVLKAAFEGRLVPQDPTDEPASVLLERIRAERAATPKPKQRRAKATA
jgi:type I restriction enzyme S subunit